MSGLRIGIDGRELEGRPTGVGRYLGGLLRKWVAEPGEERFVVFHRDEPTSAAPDSRRIEWIRRGSRRGSGTLWQQTVLARALRDSGVDVFFAPSDSMPLRWRGPTAATIHDLSYFAHPEWFGRIEGARRRWLTRMTVRRAARVVAISNFTRDELTNRLGVSADRIQVIPHGCDDGWLTRRHTADDELRSRLGIAGRFALCVGSIFERRPIDRLLDALTTLPDVPLGLVIVGEDRRRRGTDLHATLQDRGLAHKVTWLRYARDEDLAGLYRLAHVVIYLSEYEGFGLPPLEGMAFGVPAIVSDRPALNEVYSGTADIVDGNDPAAIAGALRRFVENPRHHEEFARRGRELATRRTLTESATSTLAVIRSAVGDPR